MKRISALILALLLLLSLAACAGSENSEKEKQIEKVLGEVEQLPVDFASNIERLGALGGDVLRGTVHSSSDEISCELAISSYLSEAEGSIVFADYTIYTEAKLQSGEKYPMTIHGLLVGTSQELGEGEYLLHYIGGNFELSVDAQDAQSVRERLAEAFEAKLSELNQSGIFHSGLSRSDEKLFLSLVRGKRVWLSSEGSVWESLEIRAEAKAVYDADSGTFKTMKYRPTSTVTSEDGCCIQTFDSDGRLETETRYDSETRAVEMVSRYVYPGDGTWERYDTHYDVSTGSVRWEGYECCPGDVDNEGIPRSNEEWRESWAKIYDNPDGSISEENRNNRDGTFIQIEYDETGVIRCRKQYDAAEDPDRGYGNLLWREDYFNGVLCRKTMYGDAGEEDILWIEEYDENGDTLSREEYDENGVPHRVK